MSPYVFSAFVKEAVSMEMLQRAAGAASQRMHAINQMRTYGRGAAEIAGASPHLVNAAATTAENRLHTQLGRIGNLSKQITDRNHVKAVRAMGNGSARGVSDAAFIMRNDASRAHNVRGLLDSVERLPGWTQPAPTSAWGR